MSEAGAAARRRAVGPVDTLWLHMDHPENLMVVDAVLMLEGPLDVDRFRAVLQERIVHRYPVMTQKAVEPLAGLGLPTWEPDPHFDLSRHIRTARLRRPGGDAQLARYCERQVSVPLPRDRPLWQVHVLSGYQGSASAIFMRFHHALADGMALAHILLSLTDRQPEADLHLHRHRAAPSHPRAGGGLSGAGLLRLGLSLPGLIPPAARTLTSPRELVAMAGEGLSLGVQTTGVVRKLVLGHNRSPILARSPGVPKRLVWTPPIPLPLIKAIGRASGSTVNDVVVAMIAGAIRSYLAERGEEQPGDLTTMVPVNLRPPGQPLPRELGNRFALVLLPLPTGFASAADRLEQARHRMTAIKDSPEAMITFGLIQTLGHTHALVYRQLVNFFAGKAIGVLTNVPGPPEHRWLAGTALAGAIGWVPGSGQHVLGACVFSYAGTVRVGFRTDAGVVPDPERLVAAVQEELAVLADLTGASRAG